jgi:hypothetical protein
VESNKSVPRLNFRAIAEGNKPFYYKAIFTLFGEAQAAFVIVKNN